MSEADKALEVMLEFQRTHPDTLIVMTADHGHATQIVRAGEAKAYSTLQTADGSPMRVGYSTSTSGQWHTGTQVPIAAKGPQAANILGTLDQTELYQVLKGLAPAGTDVEAPVTTATVAPAVNANGWNTTVPVTITLSATDATGVASTEFRLNGGAWTPYSAPIQVAAAGTTSVEFRSTDSAGNVETIRSRDVKIDSTAPTATVALNPAAPGAGGTYSTPVRVTLTGADAGGSGLDKVEYRFGTGAWSTYAGPFTVYTNGEHAIEYRPVDVAGNVGTAATVRFTTAGLSGTPASCVASSSDEFDGSAVDPKWSVLRPTASRYAVTGGKLQIRFDGTNTDLNGTTASATNQFLQPAPTGGPWTATTKLDMTDAKMQSNQVGFVLWQAEGSGANRFAKIVVNSRTTDASAPSRPSWWVERQVTLNSSASGAGNGNAGYIVGAVPDTVFLRVASSGGAVQTLRTYYSLDGIAWTEFLTPFTMDTTSIPLRVGLGTFRGENNPNGFARFDWFRVCDYSLDDTAPQSSASRRARRGRQRLAHDVAGHGDVERRRRRRHGHRVDGVPDRRRGVDDVHGAVHRRGVCGDRLPLDRCARQRRARQDPGAADRCRGARVDRDARPGVAEHDAGHRPARGDGCRERGRPDRVHPRRRRDLEHVRRGESPGDQRRGVAHRGLPRGGRGGERRDGPERDGHDRDGDADPDADGHPDGDTHRLGGRPGRRHRRRGAPDAVTDPGQLAGEPRSVRPGRRAGVHGEHVPDRDLVAPADAAHRGPAGLHDQRRARLA